MILEKNVVPCEGEVAVKSYFCTQFKSELFGIDAKGYLEVTNKRLLFHARGTNLKGWSAIHNEVAITDVSEIKIYKGTSVNSMLFFILLLLSVVLAGLVAKIFIVMINAPIGVIIGLGSLIYFVYQANLLSRRETFSLIINTKGGQGNVVYLAGLSPLGINTAAAKALVAKPGPDHEKLLKEIGAVISDIQTLGEYGIEKWKN